MPDSNGIASIASPFSVGVTLEKLKAFIAGKGLNLFAHIDHRAGAIAAGLQMQPAHVLIFGHAKAGTPLMVASPLLALDLPLKVLVWAEPGQGTFVSYTAPAALAARYSLNPDTAAALEAVNGLTDALVAA